MDEILKTIEECPIENLIFCYLKDNKMRSYLKGEDSKVCLNMALMVILKIVQDQVKDGEDPLELRVSLYYAINKIFDEVNDNGN